MPELTLAAVVAEIIKTYGLVGVVTVFIAYLFWQDKQRIRIQEADRLERQQNADADRLILTNHLSVMISESTKSNTQLAIGLTKLSESVNSFQSRCGKIQDDLQTEVDRLKRG